MLLPSNAATTWLEPLRRGRDGRARKRRGCSRRSASSARVMPSNMNVIATTWARNHVVDSIAAYQATVPKPKKTVARTATPRRLGQARGHAPRQCHVDRAEQDAEQLRVRGQAEDAPRTACSRIAGSGGNGSSA